jgi:hypothetical protein
LPVDAGRIDWNYRVINPPILAKFIDRLSAIGPRVLSIVVNDHIPTNGQAIVQITQAIHCRLIKVAIEPHDRNGLDRRNSQCVLEPPLQEGYLIIKEAISLKVTV